MTRRSTMTFSQWLRRTFGPPAPTGRARRRSQRPSWRRRVLPVVELLEDRLAPATLTVNSLADNTTSGDGLLTLREAIFSCNQGTLSDSSASGQVSGTITSNNTIRFAASIDGGTIQLLPALLIND